MTGSAKVDPKDHFPHTRSLNASNVPSQATQTKSTEQTPRTTERTANIRIPFCVAAPTIGGEISVGVRRFNESPADDPVPVGPKAAFVPEIAFVPVLAGTPYLSEGIGMPAPVHLAPAEPAAVTLPCMTDNAEDKSAGIVVVGAMPAVVLKLLVELPFTRGPMNAMSQGRTGMRALTPGIPSEVISLIMLSAVEKRLLWARAICWLSMSYTT